MGLFYRCFPIINSNKANLRDLIAATSLVTNLTQIGCKASIFQPVWPWNLMHDPNNGAPLLCYFKLFASFRSLCWIQTGVTVWKCLIWVKINDFFSRVTLKFDGWPQALCIISNPLVNSNWINSPEIGDMLSRVTLKFDVWPWKTIGYFFYATSSFVQRFIAIGEFKLELWSGNAQSGSNSTIFRAVRPWNLTDDLAKQ